MYFNKGAARRRLDRFLTFLAAYLLAKDPLPLDIENDLEVRGLRRGWWEQTDCKAKYSPEVEGLLPLIFAMQNLSDRIFFPKHSC
jgi:hypothetical protein